MLIDVTKDNYDQEVLESSIPVLVDFWGPRCTNCLALMPAVVVGLCCATMGIQIERREQSYAYTGFTRRHAEFERASLQVQREQLPLPLYRALRRLDRALPLPF